jgi:hypothetical protein
MPWAGPSGTATTGEPGGTPDTPEGEADLSVVIGSCAGAGENDPESRLAPLGGAVCCSG